MLSIYLAFYGVTLALLAQGLHVWEEHRTPSGVVPVELVLKPRTSRFLGRLLLTVGTLNLLLGLASHLVGGLSGLVKGALIFGIGVMALHGLVILAFDHKVAYQGKPSGLDHA